MTNCTNWLKKEKKMRFGKVVVLLAAMVVSLGGQGADLRGYGKVKASFSPTKTVFKCESPEKAAILYSKLCADLQKMETTPPAKAGEHVWRMANGSFAAVGVKGKRVVVLGANSADQLNLGKLTFPEQKYPVYLDNFDLRAFRFYTPAMKSYSGEKISDHWAFVKRLGLGGLAVQRPAIRRSLAEGVLNYLETDFEVKSAEKNQGLIVLGPAFGGQLPLWMANQYPEMVAKMQRDMLYVGFVHGVYAAPFESARLLPGDKSPIVAMQKQIMDRYKDSSALGAWHVYRGQPIGDMLSPMLYGAGWDGSASGLLADKEFLQKTYTLSQLGRRWHGAANYYRSWDDVDIMQLATFLGGGYESDRFLITSAAKWQWRKATQADEGKPPQKGDWLTVEPPPSQRCNFVDSGIAWYRLTFSAPEYLKKHIGTPLYLKMLLTAYDSNRPYIWVNGKELACAPLHSHKPKLVGVAVPEGLLRLDGENEIIVQTPDGRANGRIQGPVSLSPRAPENYPFADPKLNARYLDMYESQAMAWVNRVKQSLHYARAFDSERPLMVSDGTWIAPPRLFKLMRQVGCGFQYTAVAGTWHPQHPSIAAAMDSYFVAEPSSAVLNEENFDRMIGMQLYGGASGFDLFHNVGAYMKWDAKTGYLTRTAPMLRLFGKYLLDRPNAAFFWSSALGGGKYAWNWNLGRGEMPSAHYDADYLHEEALECGVGKRFKVLIDCGNDMLTERAVRLLTDFVRNGGTYVVLPMTGRHGELQTDTQPVTQLTGFRVVKEGMRGNIRFTEKPELFACWAGKEFSGGGRVKSVPAFGAALQAVAPSAKTLARWRDGSTAVGVRKLGKGRVVTLGSSFWRDVQYVGRKWLPSRNNDLLATLLKELGLESTVWASSEKIWMRTATAKNGQEKWLLATNAGETAPFAFAADLEYQLDFTPNEIIDRITGQTMPFSVVAPNRIRLEQVPFTKYQTRFFAAIRPELLPVTLTTWWQEKTRFWKAAPQEKLPLPSPKAPAAVVVDKWQFRPEAGAWRPLASGAWNLLDPTLADFNGEGIYRTTVDFPAHWKNRTVTFNFAQPVVFNKGEFYLNGTKIASEDIHRIHRELYGTRSFDVTKLVNWDGTNVLEARVTGSKDMSGICGPVFFKPERDLQDVIKLDGACEIVKKDLKTSMPDTIPGKYFGRYLRKTVMIPADWQGKTAYLRWSTPTCNLGCVVVNGMPRAREMALAPFPTRTELNVTELLKPGQPNTIEFWHRHTVPVHSRGLAWHWPLETKFELISAELGLEN
jgi:hypothetical protein